jgi:hypothetical protein
MPRGYLCSLPAARFKRASRWQFQVVAPALRKAAESGLANRLGTGRTGRKRPA